MTTDKQQEEIFIKIHRIATVENINFASIQWKLFDEAWQAAQAAMQPENEQLKQQLSAANQRNKELQSENETCRNLMRIKQEQNDAFSQRIAELEQRLNSFRDIEKRERLLMERVAELEERIRVSDADEPVLLVVVEENDGGTLSHRISWSEANQLPLGYWPMFVHAQIPAEVELKEKIAELEAIIKEQP